MNDTGLYYRGGKTGWFESNPGNAEEPRAWPAFGKWNETQIGFFTFDGPGEEDLPDGLAPQLVLVYGGFVGEDDPPVITQLRCAYPDLRLPLVEFIVSVLRVRPEIQPDGWREWFDYGMPDWVEELYER